MMITTLMLLGAAVASSAGVRSARADFGAAWNLVLALDVLNTAVVVYYLWRILRQKA